MIKSKWITILGSIIAVVILMLVRLFEVRLFEDPFMSYFEGDFQSNSIPEVSYLQLFCVVSMRYLANTFVSLCLLWLLFKNKSFIKGASWVYGFAFVILWVLLLFFMQWDSSVAKMGVFYTRRFLIHPMLLFVLMAGLYFLSTNKKKPY